MKPLIALWLAISGFEQFLISELSKDRMVRDLEAITRLDRNSGSEGEAQAIDYVIDQLRQASIPVTVHEFDSLISWPGPASLELLNPRGTVDAITFSFGKPTPAEGLTGEVVLAETEGEIDLANDARLKTDGLRGKIAFVEGLPCPHIARQLEESGALGGIFVSNGDRFNELIVTTIWGTPSSANAGSIPRLSGITIRRSDGQRLKTLLAAGRVQVRLKASVDTRWRRLRLPVATITGGVNDHFVLVGSHIDAWHKGGTDAGASNAMALELARVLKKAKDNGQLQRSVKIAWWPGHSTGRYSGSAWYADHRFSELDRGAIAYINMDGLGARGAVNYSTQNTAEFDDLARSVLRDTVNADLRALRPNRNSDQSFLGIGVSSLQIDDTVPLSAGGYWWWHTTEDTTDKADPGIMMRDAQAVAVAIARLAQPRLIPVQFLKVSSEVEARIRHYQEVAGGRFALNEALEACFRFEFAVKEMNRVIEAETFPITRLRVLNDRLLQMTRTLNPALYTVGGRFHPDDANPKALIPGLAGVGKLNALQGDALKFEETFLVRERNRLIDALDRASAIANTIR